MKTEKILCVTPRRLVNVYEYFGGACRLHLHSLRC